MADALSHNVAAISAITENPAMSSTEEIRKPQHSDAFCSSVAYYVEFGNETNLLKLQVSADTFFMQDGLLYMSSDMSTVDSSERLFQLLIPQSLVNNIFYHIHDSPHAEHPGRDKCLVQAKRSYF